MKPLKIEGTKFSPKVKLTSKGEMFITGRSTMEDPVKFYKPIIACIRTCQSKKFSLTVQLEYTNTSSKKVLLDLLKSIKECFNPSEIFINWYYESDDESILDMGKDFESLIRLPIDFYELCEG
jgi:hypothetical protein